jgi:hypothetical protein
MSRTTSAPKSRMFSFSAASISDDLATATINKMLREYNEDHRPATKVEEKHLRPTLDFIESVTGQKIRGIHKPLPLATLKTINALYRASQVRALSLFVHIWPPWCGGKPTLEFRSSGDIVANKDGARAVGALLKTFEIGIDPKALRAINQFMPPVWELMEKTFDEDQELLNPVRERTGNDLNKRVRAYDGMTASVERMKLIPLRQPPALNEVIYTYLRGLEFQHFVREYEEIMKAARLHDPVAPIADLVGWLCRDMEKEFDRVIFPQEPMFSVNDFLWLEKCWSQQINQIVEHATTFPVKSWRIQAMFNHAQKVIYAHKVHSHRFKDLDDRLFSLIECISAVCAVHHQYKVKTRYKPYWTGQKSVGHNPLSALKRKRTVQMLAEENYVPHGTLQLLRGRFVEFCSTFEGQLDSVRAYQQFNLARLKRIAEIWRSNDIRFICLEVQRLYLVSQVEGLVDWQGVDC